MQPPGTRGPARSSLSARKPGTSANPAVVRPYRRVSTADERDSLDSREHRRDRRAPITEERGVRVATSKREKELARMRAERQAARRAAAAARRRQRNMVIASVVAVALVALGAIFLATKVGGRDDNLASSNPSASATPSAAASNKPGTCTYTKSAQPAVKEVLYPPI